MRFPKSLMKNKVTTVLLVVAVLFFGLTFAVVAVKGAMQRAGMELYSPPPVSVAASHAKTEEWQKRLMAVGTIEAEKGIEVSAEVSGIVMQLFFTSGQEVKAGDVLLQLDDSVEQADLKGFEAQLKLARISYERDKKLLATRNISKTDYETGEAKLKELEAQVERTRAVIAQKRIVAPFSGRIGITNISLGEFVEKGAQLVTLQALNHLHVNFNIPEQYLPALFIGAEVRFTVQAFGEKEFTARIAAINPKVDPETRNIKVRAVIDNQDQSLLPGMFADLHVLMREKNIYVTVPASAVSASLYGDSVFVVTSDGKTHTGLFRETRDDDGLVTKLLHKIAKGGYDSSDPLQGKPTAIVERRYVTLGERRGSRVAIVKGLKESEQVVVAGQIKLNNGTRVIIDNSVQVDVE